MSAQPELASFIRTTFRSAWAIELLCHMRREPGHAFATRELVAALRASTSVVGQSLDRLAAAGLIVIAPDGTATFAPRTPELDRLSAAAEAYYARRPDAVRRLIVEGSHPGLAAFADAFTLRSDT